jgi:small subunit ribosomal protein S1
LATKTKKTESKETSKPVRKVASKVTTKEPTTMEELMAATGYKIKGFRRGETVKGKISEMTGKTVYVDIGGKAQAIVSEQEFALAKEYFRGLKVGDEVTGYVLISENDAGQVILSLRRAAAESKWKMFEEAMNNETEITVKGKAATKGGLLVDVEGVNGFVPSSQISHTAEDAEALVNKNIQVKVIEVDRAQNRLVLSEKAVTDAGEIEKRRKALSAVEIGKEYEGTVVGMVPFGAFIEIKVGKGTKTETLEGLVHISEISWEKIDEVGKIFKEGDKVKVQVIGVDEENGKLALSVKRLSSDPWLAVAAKYKVDSKHKGKVAKVVPYGVLVRMEKGIEGLIHASKMPVDRSFKEGEEVEVFVESVDLDKRRLSLGVVLKAIPVGYK